MDALDEVIGRTKTITFDCYGTLVDWRAGLQRSFEAVFGPVATEHRRELYDAYVLTEAQVESEAYRPYRDVLSLVVERLAARFGLELAPDRAARMAALLPKWPLFEDTAAALHRLKQRFRLGVMSNIDRDLFAHTARLFGVTLDFVVTAEDVRAYKPALGHFEQCVRGYGPQDSLLHVAQSLFHDGTPAAQLGIPFVWINRYNDPPLRRRSGEGAAKGNRDAGVVSPLAVFPDLASFAEAACAS